MRVLLYLGAGFGKNKNPFYHEKKKITNQKSQKRMVRVHKQTSFVWFYKATSAIVKTALAEDHVICPVIQTVSTEGMQVTRRYWWFVI